jgi:hypothetical protein
MPLATAPSLTITSAIPPPITQTGS